MDHGWSFDNGEFGGLSVRMAPFLERAMQLVFCTIATSCSMSGQVINHPISFQRNTSLRPCLGLGASRAARPSLTFHQFSNPQRLSPCGFVANPFSSIKNGALSTPSPRSQLSAGDDNGQASCRRRQECKSASLWNARPCLRHTKAITSSPYTGSEQLVAARDGPHAHNT